MSNDVINEELEQEETDAVSVITIDQLYAGLWVTVQHEKDDTLRQGFIWKVHGENEQIKRIKVELFDGTLGYAYAIPERDAIVDETYLFFKKLIKSKEAKSPMHFKTGELLINQWTTFRSQPRETVVENVAFLATMSEPRHLVLDAEYHWESIVIDEAFLNRLDELMVSSLNFNSKYKLKLEQFKLLIKYFS